MRRITALVGLVVALAVTAGAQEPSRPSPSADAPKSTSGQEVDPATGQPVFRTGINFVRVDVIATDRQGTPIVDLTRNDFEVMEDGKPQSVETFRLVRVDGVAPDYAPQPIRTRDDEDTAAADDNARIFVFFLDDYNVRLGNSMSARRDLAEFVRTQLAPTDLVAIMYPLTPLDAVVLTRDHESVTRALERFEGRKFRYEPRNQIEAQYADRPTEIVERIRRQVSLSALKGLSIKLGALREGRKAIILVSEGYTAMLPPQMRDAIATMPGLGNPARGNPLAGENSLAEERARNSAEFDLQTDLQLVFDAANRSNAAIYAVDPRGLSTGEFDIADNVGMRQSQEALRSTMNSLQTLAENTDGRAIVNRNDLAKGMGQIIRDSSTYYLIGYNSTPAPQDGKFHSIRVRVKRPGVQVRARKGYWAYTPDDVVRATAPPKKEPPSEVARAIALIPSAGGGNRHLVRTWFGTEPNGNGDARLTFVWEPIPAAPGVKREEPKAISLVAIEASGEEVFNGLVAPPDPVSATPAGTVSFAVKPGRLRLRLSVQGDGDVPLDNEDREVVVPDVTAPDLQLATPRVFVARNGLEFQQLRKNPAPVPTASREFRRTDRIVVRFDTFGRATGPLVMGGRLLNRQGQKMVDLPVATTPANAGAHQVDLPLASLASGEYLLEVSAGADGQDAVTALVAFRVIG